MNPPSIETTVGGYNFSWPDEKILISVSSLKERQDYLRGEVKVTTSLPGYASHLLCSNHNFSSMRSKSELVKSLCKVCNEVDWNTAIEQLNVNTMQLYRQGNPLRLITTNSEISKIDYIIHPILPRNQFSLIYGEGGTGKSTLALFMSLLIQTKDIASQYGFSMNGNTPFKPLYLDFETDEDVITLQFKKLSGGMGLENQSLYYRRCSMPLTRDLENIKKHIQSSNADVLIIDSLGVAAGGDLNEAQTANCFTQALRELNITSLVISHTSKDRVDRKTPFGSVYFWNGPRNIWEVKKVQDEGDDLINVGLFHRKSNISKLNNPIGFKFLYQNDAIVVESQKVSGMDGFERELPMRQRIKSLLLQEGVLTINEIAEQLGTGQQTIRSRLNEMRNKGDVIKQGDKFAMHY